MGLVSSPEQADSAGLPLCVVYGNCQATALAQVLNDSPAFAARYAIVRVPGVHEISAGELPHLYRFIEKASLLIVHSVRRGYRDMRLGADELIAAAPRACRVVRIPVLYYQGLFPFQAFVHVSKGGGRTFVEAPVTGRYHDLRIIASAAEGMDVDTAVDRVRSFAPDPEVLREIADAARSELRRRERDADVAVIDRLTSSPALHASSFFTVHHPSRRALREISEGVHRELGLPFRDTGTGEPLDELRTPVERAVTDALGLPENGDGNWVIEGRDVPLPDVVEAQQRFYLGRPDVVTVALREHAGRLRQLRLLKVRAALARLAPI